MPKLHAEKTDSKRTMKKEYDKLGEYFKVQENHRKAKQNNRSPIRLTITHCDNCRKEFQKGDKAYLHTLLSYLCENCQQKQKTAEQL